MINLEEITDFLEYLGDAIIIVNESSELVFANSACEEMFGYQDGGMSGMLLDTLIAPSVNINHRDKVKFFVQSHSASRAMLTRRTIPCVNASGYTFNARISIASVKIGEQSFGLATIQDFTSLQKEIEHLEVASQQDALTGLYNRRYLNKIVEPDSRILHTWKSIGIIYADLNKFKPVNDQYGHDIGDIVLKVVSNRVKKCVRFDDVVFRMGGDEFLIILNLTHVYEKEESIKYIAEKIHGEIVRPIAVEHMDVSIGVSLGCGLYPDKENNLLQLINKADKMMYSAKKNDRDIMFIN